MRTGDPKKLPSAPSTNKLEEMLHRLTPEEFAAFKATINKAEVKPEEEPPAVPPAAEVWPVVPVELKAKNALATHKRFTGTEEIRGAETGR